MLFLIYLVIRKEYEYILRFLIDYRFFFLFFLLPIYIYIYIFSVSNRNGNGLGLEQISLFLNPIN